MSYYNPFCPFTILTLSDDATEQEVIQKWKEKMLEYHPDKSKHEQADSISKHLNEAKEKAVKLCREREKHRQLKLDVQQYVREFTQIFDELMSGNHAEYIQEVTAQMTTFISEIKEQPYNQGKLFPHCEAVAQYIAFQETRDKLVAKQKSIEDRNLQISNLQRRLEAEIAANQQLQEQLSRGEENGGLRKQFAEREAELRKEFAQREAAMQEEFAKREAAIREEFTKSQAAMQEEFTKRQAVMQAVHERLAAWHSEFDAGLCLADACAERLCATLAQFADAQAAHVNAAQQQIAQLQGQIADLQEKEQQDSQHPGHNIDNELQRKRKQRKTFETNEKEEAFKEVMKEFIENHLIVCEDGKGFVSTRQMKTKFDLMNVDHIVSENNFFRELKKQMESKMKLLYFPQTVISKRYADVPGYFGIALKK